MTILRWLLCHLIIITVLVSLSLGYVFRASLKEDFNRLTGNGSLEEKVEKLPVNSDSKKKISTDEPISASPANKKEKINRPVTNRQGINKPLQHPSSQAVTTRDLSQQQYNAVPENVSPEVGKVNDPWGQIGSSKRDTNNSLANMDEKVSPGSESIFPPDDYIPEQNGPDAGNTEKGREHAQILESTAPKQMPDQAYGGTGFSADNASTTQPSAYLTALANVRKLYWNGKTGQAQEIYEKLMFDFPEQPEAAAELGNIFLQQGNRKAASWAYQNAIPRYLNLHREQEAINLTNFISQYDPAIAESLHKKYW